MALNIFKELKGVNFSCASPASTSIEQQQYSMRMSLGSSGRAIDRFSPHLRDPLRVKSLNPEQNYYSPRANNNNNNTKKKAPAQQQLMSPASSSRFLLSRSASDDLLHSQAPAAVTNSELLVATSSSSSSAEEAWRFQSPKVLESSAVTKAVLEPSRFRPTINVVEQSTTATTHHHASSSSSPSSFFGRTTTAGPQNHQVVVLRVSLHCKGCEAKVRKHLSKMEGVTSFTTDLLKKKVTVIGDVTPLGVLNSISKVKNAQLWRSSIVATVDDVN